MVLAVVICCKYRGIYRRDYFVPAVSWGSKAVFFNEALKTLKEILKSIPFGKRKRGPA